MKRAIDKWTTSASIALVFGALVACKKKTDAPAPEASAAAPVSIVAAALASATAAGQAASAAAAVTPPVVDAGLAQAAPVLGEVKRFPGKEKVATGAVKVTLDQSKVYDEPDNTKPSVASLSRDLFVVRQATLGTDWILVEFPAGVGKLSPGWIEAKSLGEQVQPVTKAVVAAQKATAVSSAKPATSAALVPTTSAAAAVTTAPPTPTVAPVVKKKPSLLSPPHH